MMTKYKRAECEDGFTVSIQASSGSYCTPREDNAESYCSVELGYPNRPDDLIIQYAEDPEAPTETVYGWVPCHIVTLLLTKHGGMVSGEVPSGVHVYDRSFSKKINTFSLTES
jgi:hypothetical protein